MARIVVVTPNPAIDVTYTVAWQTIGETHRVHQVARRPGGKGVNVARALAMLGHDPIALLPLGGVAGEWMSAAIAGLGLELIAFPISGETRTTVAVVDARHHPTLFAEAGPELSGGEVDALRDSIGAACADADLLVVAGSLPPGIAADEVGEWVDAAHSHGALALVDAGGPALLAAARAGADILKPNESELLEATGTGTVAAGIAALAGVGARTVIVSRGATGIVAVDGDGTRFETPAIPRVDGNPTGAGDAATAGVASAVLDGLSMPETLRRAAAMGAAAVLRPVAGEIDLDAYRRFIAPDQGASS